MKIKLAFKYYVIIGVIGLLFTLRLFLPYFLLVYVRHEINSIPEYRGKLKDIDVQLIKGSYTLKKLALWKTHVALPLPFFAAEKIKISIEWKAILHGKIVGQIIFYSPELNFILDPKGRNEQLTINDRWVTVVKSLFPLHLNRIEISNGRLAFKSFNATPPFDIKLFNIAMEIQNMRNVVNNSNLLPSTFDIKGKTEDNGYLNCYGRFNPFVKNPTFTLELKLNKLQVKSVANFLKHFTNVDVESGKFDLFIELAAAKGNLSGYAKPFITSLKIGKPKNNSILETIWDTAAVLVAKIIENPSQKNIATKINIKGKIDKPNTSVLSIIGYVLRHAFIEALIPQIDHSIKMNSLLIFSEKNSK